MSYVCYPGLAGLRWGVGCELRVLPRARRCEVGCGMRVM